MTREEIEQTRVRLKAIRLRCDVCGAEFLSTDAKAPCAHGYQHHVAGFRGGRKKGDHQ